MTTAEAGPIATGLVQAIILGLIYAEILYLGRHR